MKRRYILIIAILLVLTPLWMWLAWLVSPSEKMVIAIIDKTVVDSAAKKHASLSWILNHEKLNKTSSSAYSLNKDYFGFHPKPNNKFALRGLERFSTSQLDKLSNDCNALYIADTYGISKQEWFAHKPGNDEAGVLYGGLSEEDLYLLKRMKQNGKLIIAEFNTIGSPTKPELRTQFENLFHINWIGWSGRYFASLDASVNGDIPRWLVNRYKEQHGKWPFKNPGIVFVHLNEAVIILEEGTHLQSALPAISTNEAAQKAFNLPGSIEYTSWFDIMQVDTSVNKVLSNFEIAANSNGVNALSSAGIPLKFPAVTTSKDQAYSFYYFSGDFCDQAINTTASYFKGIDVFKGYFYNASDPSDPNKFFWNYYKPLVSEILSSR